MGCQGVAVIGGTGVGDRLAARPGQLQRVPTPFGICEVREVSSPAGSFFVVRRHAANHRTPPHRVEFRAIAAGLRQLGVTTCFATAAVGGLREWPAGSLAACRDFIDLTGRRSTMHDRAVVHTDVSEVGAAARWLVASAQDAGIALEDGAVYAGMDGPRYETPAEVRMLRGFGADVVGMTASTEAMLFAEVGIEYGCLAIVSNLAAGLGTGTLDHAEVVDAVSARADDVLTILEGAIVGALGQP